MYCKIKFFGKLFLKWFFLLFLLLLAAFFLGVAALYVRSVYFDRQAETEQDKACPALQYSIGDIDPRFNISTNEALAILRESEEIWEKPTKRNLLEYDPGASFKISFVFDSRQEYVKKVKQYNAEYEKLNDEYDALLKQANSTESKKEAAEIENKLSKLSELEEAATEKYDKETVAFEKEMDGTEYIQGEFTGDAVIVYKFRDTEDLKFLLAHEFGHALGLKHSENKFSIMNILGVEGFDFVTEEDLDKIRDFCIYP